MAAWLNELMEDNPHKESWLESIKKYIPVKIEGQVKAEKSYHQIRINSEKITEKTDKIMEPGKTKMLLYIYSQYTSKPMKEIYKDLNIVSEMAGWKRLSRYKQELSKDRFKKIEKLISEISNE